MAAKKDPGLKGYLMQKVKGQGPVKVAAAPVYKPNPAYAGMPADVRAVMERQDRENFMQKVAATTRKGSVTGNTGVQAGQTAAANVAQTKERQRQKALKAEDEAISGGGRGLRSRTRTANKLQGR